MIKSIPTIKALGVFTDFKWPSDLPEFQKYNLVYGWNYSGKTTLSRLFRCFELSRSHDDFTTATFCLQDYNDAPCTYDNFPATFRFAVFNTDYVRDNLKFDSGEANPILYLGTADISKSHELDRHRSEAASLQQLLQVAEDNRRQLQTTLDGKLTKKAKELKTSLSIPSYDKTKLESRIKESVADPQKYILDQATYERERSIALSGEKRDHLSVKTNPFKALAPLAEAVATALQRRLVKNHSVPRLQGGEGEQWVQQGRRFHADRDECLFCGQALPPELLHALQEHFSNQYDELSEELRKLDQQLDISIAQQINLPDSGVFYPQLAAEYIREKALLDALIEKRRGQLFTMKTSVKERLADPFAFPASSATTEETSPAISESIMRINTLIEAHNDRTREFDQKRKSALESLERHCAAEFGVQELYSDQRTQIDARSKELEELRTQQKSCLNKIEALERELSAPVKGAEAINELLRRYFGHSELTITVTGSQRFQMMRDGRIAKNLSEGERTAVAFAYFITKVADGSRPLAETIVVIDDPMSSLDSGHLFNTYALIKTKLAEVRQLFVLTHNFEFFSLVRGWLFEKDKQKHSSAYLISRSDTGSRVADLPPVLRKFKSEYHYLFYKLYLYAQQSAVDVELDLSMPNIVRRFLEAFAGVMIPISAGLQGKMDQLFSDEVERERVWKFINDFSHNTTMIRSLTIPDTSECRAVVKLCMNAVKSWDARYYATLEKEVS